MKKTITLMGALLLCASVWSQYCVPYSGQYGCSYDDYINEVAFETINNLNTGCSGGTAGYGDFTSQSTNLFQGGTYTANVTIGNVRQYVTLFFDWNHDFDFDDAGERIDALYETYENQTEQILVSVPANAILGNTRMRVRIEFNQYISSGCAANEFTGETEDYTVNVVVPASALNFDGVDDAVNLGNSLTSTLSASNTITVEAWVKSMSNPNNGAGNIVGNHRYENEENSDQFLLSRQYNNFTFWVNDSEGNTFFAYAPNSVVTSTWQHVAGTWDGNFIRLYIDGILMSETIASGTNIISNSNDISIGSKFISSPWFTGYGETFTGLIDEVRIWNTARSQCEINTYKDCEISTTEIGLLANFHFNQGVDASTNSTETNLMDAMGSNNGTLLNFALNGTTSNWVSPSTIANGFAIPASLNPTVTVIATIDTLCFGGNTTLTGFGADTYTWTENISDGTSFVPTETTTYTATGTNTATGCSSTADQLVVVNSPTSGIDVQSACGSYTWIDGNAYNISNNTATFTFLNAAGCDSVVTLNLTINSLPLNTTTVAGETITATEIGATYQWYDCNAGTMINGATMQSFTPTTNGDYRVLITKNGCTVESACVTIASAGISSLNALNLSIYPNPTKGEFTLSTDEMGATVAILSLDGKTVVANQVINSAKTTFNLSNLDKGVYFIKVSQNGMQRIERIVLN